MSGCETKNTRCRKEVCDNANEIFQNGTAHLSVYVLYLANGNRKRSRRNNEATNALK